MTEPLLQTKIFPPAGRPGFVTRGHLVEKLRAGWGGKFSLICAPAGFGKTTIAVEATRGQNTAWVSLDQWDNDPVRFLAYFVAAIQQAAPNVGERVLAGLSASPLPPINSLITTLLNDLNAIPLPIIIVLDDYQAIENPALHDGVRFILENLPPNIHLLMTSRVNPPIPLARLRARGQLTEIRAADLRFTKEETEELFDRVFSLSLPEHSIEVLETKTEGWVAGLQLAALAMKGYGPEMHERFVRDFNASHQFILDYLLEDVLPKLPPKIELFLKETAFLDRLSVPLCASVTETTVKEAETALDYLDKNNLFLVSLDDHREWFRYHRLFADLLKIRMQESPIEQIQKRKRRAAAWLENNGDAESAFALWLEAGALDEAASLVGKAAMPMLYHGRVTTLLAWLARLPNDRIHNDPVLTVHHAWALLLTGQIAPLKALLGKAESALSKQTAAQNDYLHGHIAAIRAYAASLTGQIGEAVEFAEEALTLLAKDDLHIRSVVEFVKGGIHLMMGNFEIAAALFHQAAAHGRTAGNLHVAIPAKCSEAGVQMLQGALGDAEKSFEAALQMAETTVEIYLPVASQGFNGLAQVAYERNRLDEMEVFLSKSKRFGDQWGNPDTVASRMVLQGKVALARGQFDRARMLVEGLHERLTETALNPMTANWITGFELEVHLQAGDIEGASQTAASAGFDANIPVAVVTDAITLPVIKILMAKGLNEEAGQLSERLLGDAEKRGQNNLVIQCLNLQAVLFQKRGKTTKAHEALQRSVHLSQPEGFVRSFLDLGEEMQTLLKQGDWSAEQKPFVTHLLTAFDSGSRAPETQPLVEPLSDREIEVLQWVAVGRSNQDIAEELVVSLGTIKAHTANIYRKLDVHSRTQAVGRARTLNLLPK